jgi:hypothetical protein
LTNTDMRNARLESIARLWLRSDEPTARRWIEQSSLPELRKDRLLGRSQPAPPAPKKG